MAWHVEATPAALTIASRPGAFVRGASWSGVAMVAVGAVTSLWQLASAPFEGAWILGVLYVVLFSGIGLGIASVAQRSTVVTFERTTRRVTRRQLWGTRVRSERSWAVRVVALETSTAYRGGTSYHLVLPGEPLVVLLSGGRDVTALVDTARAWLARSERGEKNEKKTRRSRKRPKR